MERLNEKILQLHREVVTADGDNPADSTGSYNCGKLDELLVALDYATGGGAAGCTIVPLWWDDASEVYYADADQQKTVTAAGRYIYRLNSLGQKAWIKVTALSGDDPLAIILVRAKIAQYR